MIGDKFSQKKHVSAYPNTWVNCDQYSHYFIAVSITLLLKVCVNSILRSVCVSISKHFLTGQLWSLLPILQWTTPPVITAPTISLQGLSHFPWWGMSTLGSVIDIVFTEGCVPACLNTFWQVICDHCSQYFNAGSITLLLRVCVHVCIVIQIIFSKGCVQHI